MRRNGIVLGRWFAGALAILMLTFIPLRFAAAQELKYEECVARERLELAVSRAVRDGRITQGDIQRLEENGHYRAEVTVGERIEPVSSRRELSLGDGLAGEGRAADVYDAVYSYRLIDTRETDERMSTEGEIILRYGDTFSICLIRNSESSAARVCKALGGYAVSPETYTGGGLFLSA